MAVRFRQQGLGGIMNYELRFIRLRPQGCGVTSDLRVCGFSDLTIKLIQDYDRY